MTLERDPLLMFNEVVGWIDQTIAVERSKKLTVTVAEVLSIRMKEIRDIFSKMC